MSSIALVQAGNLNDPGAALAAMTHAMLDRSAHWQTVHRAAASVGAGAESASTAKQNLYELSGGTVVAVSAPAWVAAQIASTLTGLGTATGRNLDALAAALGTVSGDTHCAAITPDGGLVIYRSPMAARPLFYSLEGGQLQVSSAIRGLRATMPQTAADETGLAAFLLPQLCDRTGSAWAGVKRLPPGHALIAQPDGTAAIREIGQIETPDTGNASRADLVEEFRARLLTALQRCGSGGEDAVLLSGGIDSASLSAAATVALPSLPRGYALTYQASALSACDERRYVDAVEKATGMHVTRVPADDLLPLCAEYPIGDEPEAWTYAARNWAMLQHIASEPQPVGAVFAGEGGDELLLGQVFTVADRIALGDSAGAATELATFPDRERVGAVVQALLNGAYEKRGSRIQRALTEIPPWLTAEYQARIGVVDRLADSYPHLAKPGNLTETYSRILVGEAGAAGRVHCGGWWEDTARRAGVTVTYPFLDPDLAAWTWALPPELLRDKGIEKVVLREALPELPAEVAARRDKADALVLMRAGLKRGADNLRAVADAGPLADGGVIDPTRLRTAIDDYVSGRTPAHGPALWATVAVNHWLTHTGGI